MSKKLKNKKETAIGYEPVLCPVYLDKHGQTITDGCILYNPYNNPPRQKVEIIQGKLWFGAEGTTLNTPDNDWEQIEDAHGTNEFWEIVS